MGHLLTSARGLCTIVRVEVELKNQCCGMTCVLRWQMSVQGAVRVQGARWDRERWASCVFGSTVPCIGRSSSKISTLRFWSRTYLLWRTPTWETRLNTGVIGGFCAKPMELCVYVFCYVDACNGLVWLFFCGPWSCRDWRVSNVTR